LLGRRWLDPGGNRLSRAIAASRGPVAFLDESFLAPSQWHDSFYILAAAVIPRLDLDEVRRELRRISRRSRWHAAERGRSDSGQQQVKRMANYLATVCLPVIVVVDELAKSDRSAEEGRAQALRALLAELSENHIYLDGLAVYERRVPGTMQQNDDQILGQIRAEGGSAANLKLLGLSTKREPLLWAPDTICWAFRQHYFEQNPHYFAALNQVAVIKHLK
jgi:hypothetical protein